MRRRNKLDLLSWPPDVYALTETILERSEGHCFPLASTRREMAATLMSPS